MRARIALLPLLAIVAVGCSSSSSGGGGNDAADTPPAVTPTSSASVTPSLTPSQTPTPTPTPSFSTTVKASHRCLTSDLSLSLGQGQGAAGSSFLPIVLTNTSSDPCTLYGYPGVTFLDGNGNQLGVGATRRGGQEATVTLAPNSTANAQLQLPDPGNFSPSDCNQATSARLRVIPPNDKAALTIAYVTSVCTTQQGATSVNPVTPGSGG